MLLVCWIFVARAELLLLCSLVVLLLVRVIY
jgi:hypothetical protein